MDLKNFTKQDFFLKDNIPRFVDSEKYTAAFGLQWNKYKTIQLDSVNKTNMSEDRVRSALPIPLESIKGLKVIEAGSGAGRFTEILLKYGALVYSFDLSDAVSANYTNNMPHRNLTIFQGDIEDIPFEDNFFDISLCLGVMQHTRDFSCSLKELARVTKDSGIITFDHYKKHIGHYTSLYLVYWAIIKRLPKNFQFKVTNFLTRLFFPLHWYLRDYSIIQYLLRRISPISFYYGMLDQHPSTRKNKSDIRSKNEHFELSLQETHDKNTDHYKRMLTKKQLNKAVYKFNFKKVDIFDGGTGLQCIITK